MGTTQQNLKEVIMSLVSEFLGQLTLSYGGEAEPTFPTVVPLRDFDAAKDAARLETAVKTKGVDEQTIIDILTRRSYDQRREVAFEYEKMAKKDLISALKGVLSGSLEAVMLGLMKSTSQYDASELKAAMKSKGAKEKVVTRIMVSRCEVDLMKIRTEFKKQQHGKTLYQTLSEHTKGDYQKALLSLCGGDD